MEYVLKSTAILTLFYIFYKLLLEKETFFQSNRGYFLIGLITALTLPLIIIPKYIETESFVLSSNVSSSLNSVTIQEPLINWTQWIFIIYFIGVVFFTIRFLGRLSSLTWFIYTQQKIKYEKYILIQTAKNIAPFSFFNFIVYNSEKFNESELEHIIAHEKIHVNQLHSMDILLSQFVAIFNWFNPFIWLYNKEIQKNLEFIADEYAQHITQEKKKYQYLLLKTISPNYQMALTSNFYNSLIKKRINMLQKNRSNKTMYFKFALIIPVLIAFVFTFNTKVVAQHKKMKTIEIQTDYDVEVITKDFQKSDLENLKTTLAEKGITFKYKKLKYNSNSEITSISLSVKNEKGNQSNLSQSSDKPISPIQIKMNNKTGSMSVGNMSHDTHNKMFYTSSGSGIHKQVIVKKMGDGDENVEIIWISGDSTNVFKHKGENGFVFFSDDDHSHKEKYLVKINEDSDVHFGDKKDNYNKVWVSENGDTTKLKKIELIEIDEDSDGTHKIIIKKSGDIHSKHGNMMFIDSDGGNPLFFVDGKEIENGKLEDFDNKNIETIEILKGDKAIEKYGEKAKDGVIMIKTKK